LQGKIKQRWTTKDFFCSSAAWESPRRCKRQSSFFKAAEAAAAAAAAALLWLHAWFS
jgi:hypothetical protein